MNCSPPANGLAVVCTHPNCCQHVPSHLGREPTASPNVGPWDVEREDVVSWMCEVGCCLPGRECVLLNEGCSSSNAGW